MKIPEIAQIPSADQSFINERIALSRVPFCRRTMKDLRDQGKIPFIKVGRRVLYHWPTLEAALLRMQKGPSL